MCPFRDIILSISIVCIVRRVMFKICCIFHYRKEIVIDLNLDRSNLFELAFHFDFPDVFFFFDVFCHLTRMNEMCLCTDQC